MVKHTSKMRPFICTTAVVWILWWSPGSLCAATSTSYSTQNLSLEIGPNAVVRKLLDANTGVDYATHWGSFCTIHLNNKPIAADHMTPVNNGLRFTFGRTKVAVTLGIVSTADGLVITVLQVEGKPDSLKFANLPTRKARVLLAGRVLRFGKRCLGLIPGDSAVRITSVPSGPHDLSASLISGLPNFEKEFSWIGQRAVLFACSFPELGPRISRIEDTLGIRPGMHGKYAPANRQSYVFAIGIDHSNADAVIDFARQGGFGSILLGEGISLSRKTGANVSLRRFPQGESQLKSIVERIHQAGMLAGTHVFTTKVFQRGDFVAPSAEPGLYQDKVLQLSQNIGPTDDRITTTTTVPLDWPTQPRLNDLLIGGEVVACSAVSMLPPYGFLDCQRGRYGTRPQSHQAGIPIGHLVTDESRQIFILDQNAGLFAQFADRIAATFERIGFDWIYFDGAEDVQDPRWYTTAMGHLTTLRRLARPPVIVQVAAEGAFSWHLVTRTGQRDYLQSTSLKKQIDDTIASSIPRARRALMPAEIGWFRLRYPNGHYASIDEIEYLYTKALAANAAVSLRLLPRDLASLPHRGPLLAIMRQLEELRLKRYFPPDVQKRVRQPGRDHMLIRTLDGDFALPASQPIHLSPEVRGDIKAFAAEPVGKERVVSVWNTGSAVWLEIPEPAGGLRGEDYQGNPIPLQKNNDGLVRMLVNTRLYLVARSDWRPEKTFAQARISHD